MKAVTLPEFSQGIYILATAAVIFINAVPQLESRFIRYGKAQMAVSPSKATSAPAAKPEPKSGPLSFSKLWNAFLDRAASLQVPHVYFGHFYIISIASSLFWGYQILNRGRVLTVLLHHMAPHPSAKPSQSLDQIFIGCFLVLLQGCRRLYENYFIMRKSNSKMWFVHWIQGVLFYLNLNIAVWAEGSASILSQTPIGLSEIRPLSGVPSFRSILAIPIFLLASGFQHDCHCYIASLKKYTLPNEGLFRNIICAHYFAECLIYLSLTILTAPKGCLVNKTMLTALLFTVTNLGISAGKTKEWYEGKFGVESVKGRWKMIPFVY